MVREYELEECPAVLVGSCLTADFCLPVRCGYWGLGCMSLCLQKF